MTVIRNEEPGHQAAVREIVEAAFARTAEADLVEQLHADGDVAISLVAMEEDEIIGHVVFSRMTAPFRAIGLAPISVAPSEQGRGVGSLMIEAGLKRAATEGWDAVFVLGDPSFYGRFGFETRLAAGFTSPYAGPYFMVKPVGGPLSAITGDVDYAPAFSRLGV